MKFFVDSVSMGAWTWVEEILQWIGMWIDAIVYKILAAFYNIFMAIVKLDLGDVNDMFDNLLTRIYLVLGLFMLFKISFNLLQMLANPDKVNDSRIGGAAMAKHIFISIVMLVASPFVFELLGQAQDAILENGVIEMVVLGSKENKLSSNSAGAAFSWTLLKSFLHPSDGSEWSSSNSYLSSNVREAYSQIWVCNGEDCDFSLSQMSSVVTDSTVSYTPIISSIVGIFIIFYLISFSFDVGSRIFKLMFLEVVAPIPIISYMDPGKGKDTFSRFVNEYISTYLELFIRLAIVFLALLLSNKVMALLTSGGGGVFSIGNGAIKLSGLSLALAKVILVIAIFNFAKTVPNLINSVFGFKGTGTAGKGSVGMLAGAIGLGAGALGGAIAGGVGSAAGSLMRGDLKNADGKVTAGTLGKVAANTLSGAGRSAYGMGKAGLGAKTLKVGALGAMGTAAAAGIRRQGVISDANKAGGGWANMQRARIERATGATYRAKSNIGKMDKKIDDIKKSQNYMNAQSGLESAQNTLKSTQNRVSNLSDLRNTITQEYARNYGVSMEQARSYMLDNPNEMQNYLNEFGGSNAQIQRAFEDYNLAHNGENLTYTSFAEAENNARQAYVDAVQGERAATSALDAAGGSEIKKIEGEKKQITSSSEYQQMMDRSEKLGSYPAGKSGK